MNNINLNPKKFVNLLGGEITVESEVGKGTQFYFSLKMKIGKARKTSKVTEEMELPSFEKMRTESIPALTRPVVTPAVPLT